MKKLCKLFRYLKSHSNFKFRKTICKVQTTFLLIRWPNVPNPTHNHHDITPSPMCVILCSWTYLHSNYVISFRKFVDYSTKKWNSKRRSAKNLNSEASTEMILNLILAHYIFSSKKFGFWEIWFQEIWSPRNLVSAWKEHRMIL